MHMTSDLQEDKHFSLLLCFYDPSVGLPSLELPGQVVTE